MQINIHEFWPAGLKKKSEALNRKLADAKTRRATLLDERATIKARILEGQGSESDPARMQEIRILTQGIDAIELAGLIERQSLAREAQISDDAEGWRRDAEIKKAEEELRKEHAGLHEVALRSAIAYNEDLKNMRVNRRPDSEGQFRPHPQGADQVSMRITELTGMFERL
jgi:hypothetical protein